MDKIKNDSSNICTQFLYLTVINGVFWTREKNLIWFFIFNDSLIGLFLKISWKM